MRALAEILPAALRGHIARLQASPTGYRIARGAFWSVVGTLLSRALGVGSSIAVARMLGNEGYGELGVIGSTVGLFQAFASLGLGLTATKFVAELRHSDPDRTGRIMALAAWTAAGAGGLFTGILMVGASWLAIHTLAAPHLAAPLRLASPMLLFGALNGAQLGVLSGLEAFKTIARVNVRVAIVTVPLVVVGVWWKGLDGGVVGMVTSQVLAWGLTHVEVRREARAAGVPVAARRCSRAEWRVLFRFSVPAALSGLLVAPVNWACAAMLVNKADGYVEMGAFNAANQWFAAIMFLPTILAQVMMPALARYVGDGDAVRTRKTFVASLMASVAVVIPPVIVGAIASRGIMKLYGASYAEHGGTLVIVLVTAGVIAVQTPVGQVIAASGRMWVGLVMNLGWAVVTLGLTRYLVQLGALGLALGRLGGYLVHSLWVIAFAVLLLRRPQGGAAQAW